MCSTATRCRVGPEMTSRSCQFRWRSPCSEWCCLCWLAPRSSGNVARFCRGFTSNTTRQLSLYWNNVMMMMMNNDNNNMHFFVSRLIITLCRRISLFILFVIFMRACLVVVSVRAWSHRPTQLNSTGQFSDHSARFAVVSELASWVESSWVGLGDVITTLVVLVCDIYTVFPVAFITR